MFSDRTDWNLERNKLSEALVKHRSSGQAVIDLTQSNPTECGFVYDREQILGALNNPASLIYQAVAQGLPEARRAVAEYYRLRECAVSIDDIFLSTSTSEAYSFLFRALCNPGNEVLVPQPGYPLLDFLAGIQDVVLKRYPLIYDHGWQIDFYALEQAISARTRAIVVVNPNNPTGHFCKAGDLSRLRAICAKRGLAIIADEVFLDFALRDDNLPVTFAASNQALAFTMSGLSKICGLPQMKVAWLVVSGPEELKERAVARLEIIADTYLSMNAPIQLALKTLLEQRRTFREQWLVRARENLAALDRQIAGQQLCSRLELEGGWYAVLKVPVTMSDDELALELLNSRGVYVHPGHFYDFPTDGYLVVSLITPAGEFAAGIQGLLVLVAEKYSHP